MIFSPKPTQETRRPKALEPTPQTVRTELIAYIAETLPPAARDDFDRRLLEDEFFSRQIDEAEFTLIEEFSDGTLPAAERPIVTAWIAASPRRRQQAAITSALRTKAAEQLTRRTSPKWLWALAAAACLAFLFLIPTLHHKSAEPPVVAQLTHPPLATPAQPLSHDTILLEAQRLRGSSIPTPITAYPIHPAQPTRLQILLPQSASSTEYTFDLRPSNPEAPTAPIHLTTLRPAGTATVPYLEISLPPGSLAEGHYEAQLTSDQGRYRIAFAVTYAK